MKKLRRLFIFVPALTLALTSCGFANDSSEPSSTNSPISSSETSSVATNDQEIETIYKLYVANGGTLTYEEWLRTIKGEKGDPGKDGTIIYSGNGSPSNSTGKTGDFYIDLLTWGFYVKDETSWVQKGNLKGPQGGQGETPTININDQGYWVINGQTTNVKATGTNGGQGEEGKSAYEIAVENGFQGTEEEWIESLKGENGSNGSNGTSFRNGTGAPSDSLGINGDTYLDYLNYDLYIKSNGQWVKVGNISGGGGSPAVFYTVSFNANGGSGEQQEFITSGELVLPECTFVAPIGKHFSAWQYSETEYQPGDHLEIDDDATISALWAFNEVAVSFDANGGSGEQDDVVIIPGEYTLPECTFVAPIGKHFASWSYNNNTYQPGEVISVTENVEVNAVWQTNVYTVTWNDHDGTLLRADIVEYGETPVYGSNPTRENDSVYSFEFAGWDPSINIVTGDVTYTATYTRTPLPGSLHITFDGNGADGVMADDYVYPGSLYVLPECGFTNNYRSAQFLGWKVNGEDMVPGAYTFINEDTIIKARYSYRFEVEYTALDGHAVVVDLDKLDGTPDGKRYTLIYDQNRGYWYRDIEVENNVYQVTYYDIIAQNLQNYGHIGLLGSEEDYLFYLGSENHPLVGYDGNGFYYNGDIEYGKAIYLISSYTGWDTLREEYRFSYDEVNHRWYLPFRPIENEMFYTFYRFVIDDYDNPTTSSDNFDISLTPISRCCDIGGNIGSIINPYTIDNIYNSSSLINEYAFVTAYVDSIDDAEMNNGRMDGVVFRNEAGDKTIVNLGLYAYDGIDPDATMCLEPGDEVVFLAYISSTEDSLTNEITYTFDEGGMIVACNGAPLGGKDPDHPSSMTHLQFINYVCPTYKQPFYTEGEVYSIFGADPDNLTKNCWARSANLPILGDSINGIVVMGTDAPYHFANIDEYNAFSSGNARVVFRNEWNDDLQYIACYPYSYYIYEDAYYLLGSFNNWVVMDPAYRLVEDSVNQGVYYLTGLELTEGQTLRVVDSNNAYFPSEGTFHIIEDGIYTISFDSNNNSINAVKTGEYVPEITYYLVGSFCNWELDSDYLMTPDSENNNYYTIKDVALKEGDLVKARTNTGIYFPDGINNDYVVPCDGLYTFYVAGSDLCVTVPDDPNAVEDYIVYGKVGSSEYGKIENLIWNDKDGQFEIENLQLNEGDELKFHIEDTYWLGYDEIDEEYGHPELFTRHNPVNSEDMGGNNIIVNEDGVYSFYFVEQSNHTIKIYAVKENTSSGDEPVDPTPVDPTPDPEPEPDPEPVVIPNYIVYGKVGETEFGKVADIIFNDKNNQLEAENIELNEGDEIKFHIEDTYWLGYDEIDEVDGNRDLFDRHNPIDENDQGGNNIIVNEDGVYSFYFVEQSNHTIKIYAVKENTSSGDEPVDPTPVDPTPDPDPEPEPVVIPNYIVYGKVGETEFGKIADIEYNNDENQLEAKNIELNAGDELKFHIEDTYWLGYDEIDEEYGHPELFTRHNPVNSEDMGGNNIIVNEDGVYSFYFVEQSNHTIKIYAVKENTSSGDEPVDPTPVDPTPDPEPEPDPEPVVIPNYIVYGKVGDNDFNVIKEMSFNDNQWEVTNVELHEGDQIVFHIQDTYWVGYDEIDETSGNRVFFDRNNSADGANNIIVKADSTYSFYLVEQSNHTFKIYAVDENEEEVIIQDAPTSGYHVKIMSGNNVTYVHAYDTGTTSYNKSVYRASNVTLKDGDIIMMYNGNTGLPFNCATSSKLYTSSSASGSFQYISNAGGVRVKKDGTYTIELQLAYGDDSYYIY